MRRVPSPRGGMARGWGRCQPRGCRLLIPPLFPVWRGASPRCTPAGDGPASQRAHGEGAAGIQVTHGRAGTMVTLGTLQLPPSPGE